MQNLTEEVLKEIPHQVVQYFQKHGLFDKKSFKKLTTVMTEDLPSTDVKKQFLMNNINYFNATADINDDDEVDSFDLHFNQKKILKKPSIQAQIDSINEIGASGVNNTIQNNYNITLNNYAPSSMNIHKDSTRGGITGP